MASVESAWASHPGYRVDLVPWRGRARIRLGDRLLAETDGALLVYESDHATQVYFPESSVRWELFSTSEHSTTCPFKGEARYWSLSAAASDGDGFENVVWAYQEPMNEVAGLRGFVAFYADRLEVELLETFADDPDHPVITGCPPWGDAADLVRLLNVEAIEPAGRFRSPSYPDPPIGTFFPQLADRSTRMVVEGGQLLGESIVAASRVVPDQRVVSASMIFSRPVMFDAPHEVDVELVRPGRGFSTLETRTSQGGKLCSLGILLTDAGARDLLEIAPDMPRVPDPADCEPIDFGVTGREFRSVDGAYNRQDVVGPPEIMTWARFREAPDDPAIQAALLAQSTTHWSIAAGMRPYADVNEGQAHVTISTGPLQATLAIHDEVDVAQWLLYANTAIFAGRGQVQGEGRVFTRSGRLVASYTIHAMVRAFARPEGGEARNYRHAM